MKSDGTISNNNKKEHQLKHLREEDVRDFYVAYSRIKVKIDYEDNKDLAIIEMKDAIEFN